MSQYCYDIIKISEGCGQLDVLDSRKVILFIGTTHVKQNLMGLIAIGLILFFFFLCGAIYAPLINIYYM